MNLNSPMNGKVARESRERTRARVKRTFDSFEPDNVFNWGLDLRRNQLYLNGVDRGYEIGPEGAEPGVDFVMATNFTKGLNLCQMVNPGKPVLVHMSTCGGDWNFGMHIYDAIKAATSPVTIVNYTHARSMSSIILQAADWRVMMPNSHFMFHDGQYQGGGTVKEARSDFKFYDEVGGKTMLRIYAEQMKRKGEFAGKSFEEIEGWLRDQMDKHENVYKTAEETVSLGLADEIFQGWNSYLDMRTHHPKIPLNARPKRRATKKSSTRSRR